MRVNSLDIQTRVTSLENEINAIFNKIYPIGCIYMSVDNTNPTTLFGGEWIEWGSGKVPVGVNSGNVLFNTVEKTGGSVTHTLTATELPAHTHTLNNHTHSIPAHSHGLNSHTHSFSATTRSTTPTAKTSVRAVGAYSDATNTFDIVGSLGGSNTNISINERTWSGNHGVVSAHKDGNISNPPVFDMTISMPHTHTLSGITGAASGSTANSSALTSGTSNVNTSSVGSGSAHNNLQPYITCYMFKRIA